jgi:hypothetical protein
MKLLAGCGFAVAPRFHLDADWPARLAVGSGVEEAGGKFFPRGPWRPATPEELALLVAAGEPVAAAPGALPLYDEGAPQLPANDPDDCVCLFQLPEHIRGAWWKLFDGAAEAGGPVRGFDPFAASAAEFLAFKGLGASGALQMEVLVAAPGARSIRTDPATGRPAGLGPTVAAWAAWPFATPDAVPRLRAVVNLGDGPAAVVLFNLVLTSLAVEPAPATVGELVAQVLDGARGYPPVRLRLGPGEGCWLPRGGLILDGDATGADEPCVLLLISDGGASAPP